MSKWPEAAKERLVAIEEEIRQTLADEQKVIANIKQEGREARAALRRERGNIRTALGMSRAPEDGEDTDTPPASAQPATAKRSAGSAAPDLNVTQATMSEATGGEEGGK